MRIAMKTYRHHRNQSLLPTIPAVLVMTCICIFPPRCRGQNYDDISRLFDDKLGPNSNYKTTIRPMINQSKTTDVNVTFDILSIVEVEATTQKFVINGFLSLLWIDELIAWNLTDYKVKYIHPYPNQVWRPRIILINTRDERDIFEDDYSPLYAIYTGHMAWMPGSLFQTSCPLDLYKYPFDEQRCVIALYSMGVHLEELQFHSLFDEVGTAMYVKSGEWTITSTKVEAGGGDPSGLSYIRVVFNIRRLPGFFIVNIVLPVIMMSFLNILVFLIPVDSGEKIGYGITVLLALTVFMSIVSEQLPRTSDPLPIVTIYLMVLAIISVFTVIVSIIIVFIHHRDEKEVQHKKAAANFKSAFHKVSLASRTIKALVNAKTQHVTPVSTDDLFSNSKTSLTKTDTKRKSDNGNSLPQTFSTVIDEKNKDQDKNNESLRFQPSHEGGGNNWRQTGRHLDMISFVVFTVIWISVTVGFLVEMVR